MKFFLPGLGDENNVIKCPKASAVQCITEPALEIKYERFDYMFSDDPRPSAIYQVKLTGDRNFAMLFSGKGHKHLLSIF